MGHPNVPIPPPFNLVPLPIPIHSIPRACQTLALDEINSIAHSFCRHHNELFFCGFNGAFTSVNYGAGSFQDYSHCNSIIGHSSMVVQIVFDKQAPALCCKV